MAELFLGGLIDPAQHSRTDKNVLLPSGDFTTHGVIVGMTGSGKTGLGIVLIEEALSAGVPTLLIDPKGDLTNLCLTFPALAAIDFEPWVNEGDAGKAGATVPEFAAAQAKAWADGLAGWGLGPDRIAALRARAEFTIYTPGSNAGVGLDIIGSLRAPTAGADPEIVGDEIEGFVSGLLSLVDIEADPLSSREHILLSNLIHHEWNAQRDLDLPTLVGMVLNPPIRKLGVFELDQFFPPKDRTAFAMRLNGLLASPSFSAWMNGPPLDIDTMLHSPDGKPRCAIVTTAHLSDQERQFVTTLGGYRANFDAGRSDRGLRVSANYYLNPALARSQLSMEKAQNLGLLGQAAKGNTAGFREEADLVTKLGGAIAAGEGQIMDLAGSVLSAYGGGMLGGMGGGGGGG